MKDVLIIDDDGELLQSLARAISPLIAPLLACGATRREEALELLEREDPKAVVLDLCLEQRLGVESGFDCLAEIRRRKPHARVILLTGHGSRSHGVRALALGAASFLEKPADPAHLAALIRDAASQAELRREHERLLKVSGNLYLEQLCGSSPAMHTLRERLEFVAATPQSVLLLGETGTGKGLCARVIHELSRQRSHKFVHYQPNFGGGDIVQSELFGHVRGAFTGATEGRRGLVLEAARGTLFIDELDEVPLEAQVKLLDLLQERRVRPLGADSFMGVECRFIAATNRDIDECLASGKIRRDLHHRIAQCVVRIPPLRERAGDIPELGALFLRRLRESDGINVFDLSPEALRELAARAWPGNVRELQGVIETAAFHAHFRHRNVVEISDLEAGVGAPMPTTSGNHAGQFFHDKVERFKATLIGEALERTGGNQVHAARLLGLDRGTLRRVLSRLATA
jgi:DNA-binding NtrC family response regulator